MNNQQPICDECKRKVSAVDPVDGWCQECIQNFEDRIMETICGDSSHNHKADDKRKCENCGSRRGFMAYIPFNGGMIVCRACLGEWERLGEPKTVEDYHRAINQSVHTEISGNANSSDNGNNQNNDEETKVSFAGDVCENCRTKLYGSLSVSSGTICGIGYVQVSEDRLRNWILCDFCNALLCHACAPNFKTGFCEKCIREYNLKFDSAGGLL